VWDAREYEAAWEKGFAHLEQYVAEHGDTRVPAVFKDENGYNLGKWADHQRTSAKRSTMSAERVTRLDGLGFVWDTRPGA
jgi:hypothetical protein